MTSFRKRLKSKMADYETLIARANKPAQGTGVYQRWQHPVLTADHCPVFWCYDMNEATNPGLLERQGVNATFNAGAILFEGKYRLVVRVEGVDRKSFFAIAESPNGVDNFRFWNYPVTLPQTCDPDVNVYDMRLTRHEDGFIYGLFCTERRDQQRLTEPSAAIAQCGIVRTTDMSRWERLPDLRTPAGQQRNVVLHPEFVEGKYALYTRPQDDFVSVGRGEGIGWGLTDTMDGATILEEKIVDARQYHTIKEIKNGLGPAPIKTRWGWLQLAHGVRNTAAGLRYVLYLFMTDLDKPWIVTHRPAGYFIAPKGQERVGDVSNVVFANGWIKNEKDEVFIYYSSSDTRVHVATSTVDLLLDYVTNTPEDRGTSNDSLEARKQMITANLAILETLEL